MVRIHVTRNLLSTLRILSVLSLVFAVLPNFQSLAAMPDARSASISIAAAQCQGKYQGIELCSDAINQTHAIRVDLKSPGVRFKAVLANDNPANPTAPPVDSLVTKPASQMGTAWGAVAAINTDYFGQGHHGVEGLFYRDGMRLDNVTANYRGDLRPESCDDDPGDPDTRACRSSLAISAGNDANIGFGDRSGYMHNVVGGGPIFMRGGQYARPIATQFGSSRDGQNRYRLGGESPFARDYFAEPPTHWTVAGLDQSRSKLTLMTVGSNQNIDFVVQKLQELGVDTAIKLDGGGSSQMYYDGATLVSGSRSVPSALLVFAPLAPPASL